MYIDYCWRWIVAQACTSFRSYYRLDDTARMRNRRLADIGFYFRSGRAAQCFSSSESWQLSWIGPAPELGQRFRRLNRQDLLALADAASCQHLTASERPQFKRAPGIRWSDFDHNRSHLYLQATESSLHSSSCLSYNNSVSSAIINSGCWQGPAQLVFGLAASTA